MYINDLSASISKLISFIQCGPFKISLIYSFFSQLVGNIDWIIFYKKINTYHLIKNITCYLVCVKIKNNILLVKFSLMN